MPGHENKLEYCVMVNSTCELSSLGERKTEKVT